jgi:hypothetical protein
MVNLWSCKSRCNSSNALRAIAGGGSQSSSADIDAKAGPACVWRGSGSHTMVIDEPSGRAGTILPTTASTRAGFNQLEQELA